jgi:hypothetical protein
MPADFGEIADYHRREAHRFLSLAQAARERESFSEAEYLTALAARHTETSHEQKMGMRQEPGPARPASVDQMSRRWPPEPQPTPFAAACLLAALRGAEQIALVFRRWMPKRSERGLSHR